MKKYLLLAATLTLSAGAWAESSSSETVEYCKHKYEQVTQDVAFEHLGCKFNDQTQKYIIQNRENTYLNCQPHLDDKTRSDIGQASLVAAKVLMQKFGKEEACGYNSSLYPEQIYN
ncbi:hypothetical protein [Acinetobacter sp.]|uniref:hypothetical protein n=1 Tax=Acinetobacter sp. TaxID=472 RepID=UPI0035B03B2D